MKQCPNCGVESDENANYCSLCGIPLLENTSDIPLSGMSGRIGQEERIRSEFRKLSGFQKRKIFWKISGLVFLSAILITLIVDYVATGTISWSRYPATICLILFINSTLNTYLHHNWLALSTFSFFSVALLFILFDLYSPDYNWRAVPGLLVLLAAYSAVFGMIVLIRRASQKGLNVIAYSLLVAGVLSMCTEAMLSIYKHSTIVLGWSLITAVSVITVSLLLLYIHYRLKRATDLKRFFHI